jgi:hypothetical protein
MSRDYDSVLDQLEYVSDVVDQIAGHVLVLEYRQDLESTLARDVGLALEVLNRINDRLPRKGKVRWKRGEKAAREDTKKQGKPER